MINKKLNQVLAEIEKSFTDQNDFEKENVHNESNVNPNIVTC